MKINAVEVVTTRDASFKSVCQISCIVFGKAFFALKTWEDHSLHHHRDPSFIHGCLFASVTPTSSSFIASKRGLHHFSCLLSLILILSSWRRVIFFGFTAFCCFSCFRSLCTVLYSGHFFYFISSFCSALAFLREEDVDSITFRREESFCLFDDDNEVRERTESKLHCSHHDIPFHSLICLWHLIWFFHFLFSCISRCWNLKQRVYTFSWNSVSCIHSLRRDYFCKSPETKATLLKMYLRMP